MNRHSDSSGFGAEQPATPLDLMAEAWWRDFEEGKAHDLAHYLKRFPGDDIAIALEFIALRKMRDEDPAEEESESVRLGPYVLGERLGRGGQATVFRAWDTRHRRTVALKVLPKSAAWGEGASRRFQREAFIMAQLDHNDVCTVYEARMDERPYIAMQYVKGDSLATRIARARRRHDEGGDGLPSRREIFDLVRLGKKAARALAFVHAQRVVHRDIKPANIMVRPDGTPKLVDFGLAHLDAKDESLAQSMTQGKLGTLRYMSVEQVLGSDVEVDSRTDIYSLGLTLYEALTLHYPFAGRQDADVIQSITTHEPARMIRLNRSIPRDLQTVVEKCLEKNRDKRYATADELGDDLARVEDGLPVSARSIGPIRRTGRWMWRHPAKATSMALAVVLGAALLWLWNDRQLDRQRKSDARVLTGLVVEGDALDLRRTDDPSVASWIAEVEELLARARKDRDWTESHSLALGRLEGVLERILGRLHRFREFEREALRSSDVWNDVIADIAAAPEYGFEIVRQSGLEPFRKNEEGYWEFWLKSTADEVPKDVDLDLMADQPWTCEEDWPVILVLLPGMRGFKFSSTGVARDVDPFFIGKFEVTQRQWRNLMDSNPSHYSPETARWMTVEYAKISSFLHPVELMTWHQATRFALRAFARLPTEIEWEYACRAGATGRYWWGDDAARGRECENILGTGPIMHRVVGSSKAANGFELYDMQGNVSEWNATLRTAGAADVPVEPRFELPDRAREDFRASVRGAAWNTGDWRVVVATTKRSAHAVHDGANSLGLRVARRLDR